jgi:hypothetical protein
MSKRGLKGMEEFEKERRVHISREDLPKEYLSFSQVDLYRRCSKAYYYRYVMEEITPPASKLIQGKAVHSALEHNYRQKIETRSDLPTDDVIDAFSTDYDKSIPDAVDISFLDKGKVKDRSVRFLKKYQRDYAPQVQPVSVEDEFSIELENNVVIKGYVDLVQEFEGPCAISEKYTLNDHNKIRKLKNREKVIVDHKVTSRAKRQDDTDSSMQLSIYSHVLDIPNVAFDALVVNPKNGKDDSQAAVRTLSHRHPDEFNFTKSVIMSVADAISKGSFPKTGQGTWICRDGFCPHFKKCHSGE